MAIPGRGDRMVALEARRDSSADVFPWPKDDCTTGATRLKQFPWVCEKSGANGPARGESAATVDPPANPVGRSVRDTENWNAGAAPFRRAQGRKHRRLLAEGLDRIHQPIDRQQKSV
jgi:hypothetical protein